MEDFKFFGRRKGRKIRKAKTSLLERFLPQLNIDGSDEISPALFSVPVDKIWLEIGFGGGEHLSGVSQLYPHTGFIGAEVFQNGIANLLSLITGIKQNSDLPENITLLPNRVDNIRIFSDDVRKLFARIPDGLLDGVFLLFPDPWPKKRHADRRFINPENLSELARIIRKGGTLFIATDHPVYKRWTLEKLYHSEDFVWTAQKSSDWRNPPSDWIETKYQQKALKEGRRPVFLNYRRL